MNREMSEVAEAIEMDAWADMMEAMPDATRLPLDADCRRLGSALSVSAKNLPLAQFNRVMGVGLGKEADQLSIAALREHVREKSNPVVQVQIAPFAGPTGIEELLRGGGFSKAEVIWVKMGREAERPPVSKSPLAVEEATDATKADFARAVREGFGMPPFFGPWLEALVGRRNWRCHIARDGAEAVGGAALYLYGEHAWLGIAAVLPKARGKGGQSALMARRIADASALGKRWVFTETGVLGGPNPSLQNMRRTDFALLHERANWVLVA